MKVNLTETIQVIKKAGATNVRATPMPGQNVATGMYRIETRSGSTWSTIADGMPKSTAEDIINQAVNRTICG